MNKFAILGFDMETDIGSYLKTYHGVVEGTPKIMKVLEKSDAAATFLVTGDVAERHPEVIRQLADAGYEVGCHGLMHETVGDAHFNMPNDTAILAEEAEHRLSLNSRMVEECTGRKPVSFRAPRLWQGHGQVAALNSMGFTVDLSYSVTAHKDKMVPYHPDRGNWLQEGDLEILEIPNFAFLDEDPAYHLFFGGNDQWPLLRLLGAEFVMEHARSFVENQLSRCGMSVLLFYLHPWEFVPMPSLFQYDEGVFIFKDELHKNCGPVALNELDVLIRRLTEEGFQFTTAQEFVEIWDKSEDR